MVQPGSPRVYRWKGWRLCIREYDFLSFAALHDPRRQRVGWLWTRWKTVDKVVCSMFCYFPTDPTLAAANHCQSKTVLNWLINRNFQILYSMRLGGGESTSVFVWRLWKPVRRRSRWLIGQANCWLLQARLGNWIGWTKWDHKISTQSLGITFIDSTSNKLSP
jgi:hypothetical protein